MVNVHRYSTLETDLTHTVLEWWYEDLHGRQPVISPAVRALTRAIRCAVWRLRRVIIIKFFNFLLRTQLRLASKDVYASSFSFFFVTLQRTR